MIDPKLLGSHAENLLLMARYLEENPEAIFVRNQVEILKAAATNLYFMSQSLEARKKDDRQNQGN